jgi:hypothetical protein
MSESQYHTRPPPSLLPIERPRCPKCHARMMLVGMAPGPEGFEHRNFECGKCKHIENTVIASDPMKADAAGWLMGELRPPK